jgi:hypothetical protein
VPADATQPDNPLAESLRRAAARPDADPRLRAWLDKLLADAAEDAAEDVAAEKVTN